MVLILELLIVYVIVGIIYISIKDETGETNKIIKTLVIKSFNWPIQLYNDFLKNKN